MDLQLKDKLCVVTGSTGGIGMAIAKMLAQNGAVVIVNGRSEESTETAVQIISKHIGGNDAASQRVWGASGDVSSADGVESFISKIMEIQTSMKREVVDVLINNVGMFHSQDFVDVTDEKWSQYYDTNTMSGVRLSRHFLPRMMKRNSFGRVLFVSSEGALKPLPNMIPYCVSKTSQLSLSRGLAELTKGSNNITVNALLPGPTLTQGVKDYMKSWASDNGFGDDIEAASSKYFEQFEPTSLLQRFLDPDEIAFAAVFLCSPRASGINGIAQHVDGGIVRHIS
ncbi:unnamed protein product [Cylindrotheca closterium]|uniref:3-oxoacyl-[acyl-carrier-protein] reductase n=1 Tax=Cylindrotheca closterium TaxID=2856 RepID=A0AAD2G506_9STRA|nr:unnamed protein product [Cylindrotheca closterium]